MTHLGLVAMQSDIYPSSFDLKGDSIRLVKLLPGTWTDDIHCQLVHNSLSNVPPYHALSYVWGSRNKMACIYLEARPFYITTNLERALRHLRHQLRDTLLWIDALSINQIDNRERTHQVNLMGNIYESSQSVLVYLGDSISRRRRKATPLLQQEPPPIITFSDKSGHGRSIERSPQSDLDLVKVRRSECTENREMQNIISVFTFIQKLSQGNHLGDIPVLGAQPTDTSGQDSLKRLFESLRQLMHAPFTPWWTRIWCVQEVILPPKVTVVHGTVSAPWSMFAQAASRCSHHIHHCCAKQVEKLPRDIVNVLRDFCERVLDIELMRSIRKGGLTYPTPDRLGSNMIDNEITERSSLITLLRRFRHRKATDPRDKVYALLSLVEPSLERPPLLPDYSLSDAEVYIRASIESIYASKSLSVLSIDVARKYRHDLPSWVPDWEAPGDFSHNERISTMSLYGACSEYPVDSSNIQLLESRTLSMQGIWTGCVNYVGKVMLSESTDTIRDIMDSWITASSENRSEWNGDLWRILCADVIYDPKDSISGIPRRAQASDEFMFVTWANLSKKSPFYHQRRDLTTFISPMANIWHQLLVFELLVHKDLNDSRIIKDVAYIWKAIHPDKAVRVQILDRVITNEMMKTGKHDSVVKARLIHHATASISDIEMSLQTEYIETQEGRISNRGSEYRATDFGGQAKQLQIQAWKKVPWRAIYADLELHRSGRLDFLTEQLRLSYDTQISIMDRSIVSATKARCLYMTNRHVGLGPTNLKQNDELYIIKGGNTPFFLRGSSLVGDCYAFGLMDSAHLALARLKHEEWIATMMETHYTSSRDDMEKTHPSDPETLLLRWGQWRMVYVS